MEASDGIPEEAQSSSTATELSVPPEEKEQPNKNGDNKEKGTSNNLEPSGPPAEQKEDGKTGSLPGTTKECWSSSLLKEFSFRLDQEPRKKKDGEDAAVSGGQELSKPAAKLEEDEGKGNQPKTTKEFRQFPTAALFSFRIDPDRASSEIKDGGQSSTEVDPDRSSSEIKDGGQSSTEVDPDRASSEIKDGGQSSTEVDPDRASSEIKDGGQSSTEVDPGGESSEIKDGCQSSTEVDPDRVSNEIKDGVQSSTEVDPDRASSKIKDGGQSSAEVDPDRVSSEIKDGVQSSAEVDPDRVSSEIKDGGQSSTEVDLELSEPLTKLLKLEGDSKKGNLQKTKTELPRKKKKKHEALCGSLVRGEWCRLGTKCLYEHDINQYMARKPPDLGDSCVLFSLFGKCWAGACCRFARAHLGEDFQNLVNEELWKKWDGKSTVKNSFMEKGTNSVNMKWFPYKKSMEYLHCLTKVAGAAGAKSQAAAASAGGRGMSSGPPASPKSMDLKAASAEVSGAACLSQTQGSLSVATESPSHPAALKTVGVLTDEDLIRLRPCEKKKLVFKGKLYLSPLSKYGTLPFRRICKKFGADITCGEIVSAQGLISRKSLWSAPCLHRHETEDIFGLQVEGSSPEEMVKCAEFIKELIQVDFVDINAECANLPVVSKGAGCALMSCPVKLEQIVRGMNYVLDVPLTVKLKIGVDKTLRLAHTLIPKLRDWGVSMVTLHGRSKDDLYTSPADWRYIGQCAKIAPPMPLFGNGDIFSFKDAVEAKQRGVSGLMIARAALIKPWIFTEIKELRHWDISGHERLNMLKDFTNYGLEYWGPDTKGVEKTRIAMLEWLSFLCRYIPVGLLEHLPPKISDKPPNLFYGDYLESLMSSEEVRDWIKISEMFLGPAPENFKFNPVLNMDSYLGLL